MEERTPDSARLRIVDPVVATHSRGGRVRRETSKRRETLLRGDGRIACRLEVISPHASGVAALLAEASLLEALSTQGIHAVPAVLDLLPDGYVRESGRPLRHGTGRRVDRGGAPADEEKQARIRAREDVDRLLDALHSRDIVLGLQGDLGLAVREDGSVLLDDLGSLRSSVRLEDRLADQHWLDSVLQDQGRTLVRRVSGAGAGESLLSGAVGESGTRDGVWLQGSYLPQPQHDSSASPSLDAITPRRAASAARVSESRSPRAEGGQSRRTGPLAVIGRVGPRGMIAAVSMLAAGASLGILSFVHSGTPEQVITEPVATTADRTESSVPATQESAAPEATETDATGQASPALTDAEQVLTSLAQRRQAYVLGSSQTSAAAPGSAAESRDRAVRDGYDGRQVQGWTTVVHDARVLEHDEDAGVATLEASIEESGHTVVEPDGSTHDVDTTGTETVRVELVAVQGEWLIRDIVVA